MSKYRIYTKNLLKSESNKDSLEFFFQKYDSFMIEYQENLIWWENFFFDLKYQEDYVLKSIKIDWYQKFSYSFYLWIWMIPNWYLLNSWLEIWKNLKKIFSDSPKNSIIKNIRWRIWWFFISNRYQNIVYLISRVSYNDHVFS